MQVHTFIADSASAAVDRIRAELGPTAVVLSVRKLPRSGMSRFLKQEQIEVVATVESESAPVAREAQLSPSVETHSTASPDFAHPIPQRATLRAAALYRQSASPAPELSPVDPLDELRREIRTLKEHLISKQPLPSEIEVSKAAAAPAVPVDVPSARSESGLASLLVRSGIMPLLAEQVLADLPSAITENTPIPTQIQVLSEVLRRKWRGEPARQEAGVHVFVGVHGCGKSTVLCKMLAQASLAGGQPATVYQLDGHITNTSPQPSVYAEILGAEFERTFPLQFEWREQSVFVDLPGVELGNERALTILAEQISGFGVPEVHLVLNAAYEPAQLLEQVRFFSKLGISDLILAHLDEEPRWGKIWNFALGTNYNVRFLSSGQNIPGEFIPATAETVLSRQFRGK